jgi:galactokinase
MIVRAPGRVNLIGDHTDYTGGLVLPMAIDRWTVLEVERTGSAIHLTSEDDPVALHLPLPVENPREVHPTWGRYVAGVAAEMNTNVGMIGTVSTTIPIGSGLSSSAALEVAVALGLGFDGSALDLALMCQRAEQRASGVPCGVMDQLCIAAAVEDHAVLIDCTDLTVTPIPIPHEVDVVVQFVAPRRLVGSEYANRVSQCRDAERIVGPLRLATVDDLAAIDDAVVAARARHVVTENDRVRRAVEAMDEGRLDIMGRLMLESHRSLSDDFATSTNEMDAAVTTLMSVAGVYGARMTGGGFGGCVVAIVDRSRAAEVAASVGGWIVRPVGAAARV